MERVTLQKSNETGKYEIIKIEPFSEAEEVQALYEAREKAIRDESSRLRTATNKGIIEGEKKKAIEIAKNLLDVLDVKTIAILSDNKKCKSS